MRKNLSLLNKLSHQFGAALKGRHVWVALSGGMDSVVLLHATHALKTTLAIQQLSAIHIHHGLSPQADQWATHCEQLCTPLKIPCVIRKVKVNQTKGESLENLARQARYGEFKKILAPHDLLLLAHHQDDQAETLILQLIRGAGVHGLSAMPGRALLGLGEMLRPFLTIPRREIYHYAQQHHLSWVEDASNQNLDFDRNFLRHEIMPRLLTRFKGLNASISRSSLLCADAANLMDHCAQQDLTQLQDNPAPDLKFLEYTSQDIIKNARPLWIPALLALTDSARIRNVLRYWIKKHGLTTPDYAHIQRIMTEVLTARPDGKPLVRWTGGEVRRYRHYLYAMANLPVIDKQAEYLWQLNQPLAIVPLKKTLMTEPCLGQGIKASLYEHQAVWVKFRQGGESCKIAPQTPTKTLKHLFQTAGIPPWERSRLPLIYIQNTLAAVAHLWVCTDYAAQAGEEGLKISWQDQKP